MLAALAVALIAPSAVAPSIETTTLEYRDGETVLEGTVVRDARRRGSRPAVMIVHDWDGPNAHELRVARKLADMGYIAFVADIYGKGVRPTSMAENAKEAGKFYGDPALFRSRLLAGFETTKNLPDVDRKKIAAYGYCFGGSGVLRLARTGADVRSVVSFHGGLDEGTPAENRAIRSSVLVLHGADDPMVPPKDVFAFRAALEAARKPYTFVAYPGAVHAFAVQEAGSNKASGAAYDPAADRKSWARAKAFLNKNGVR